MEFELYDDIREKLIQVDVVEHREEKSIEFQVKEDFEKSLPAILSNIEQIKEWAVKQTELDRSMVLQTPEDFANAKSRCAQINRLVENIEAKRKEVKKAYTAPYEVFEKSIKEVISVLTSAKNNLWAQISEADETEKNNRKTKYAEYFDKTKKGTAAEYLTFDSIFDKKWLNRTTKEKAVYEAIDNIVTGVCDDIQEIELSCTEFTVPVISYYQSGNSLKECLKYYRSLIEKSKTVTTHANECKAEHSAVMENIPEQTEEALSTEEYVTLDFRVVVTHSQLSALKSFLIENKIKYGRIN